MVGLAASFAASRCVLCRTGRSIYARSRGVASLVLPCGCVWTCRMMWHASCRFNHILLLPARPPHARCAALTYSPRVHAMPQTGDERCLKQRRGKLWERVLWMRACAVHRGRIRVAPGRRWVFASAALFGRHLCCHADMPMCCEFLCDAAETREMFRSCSATPGLLMLCALWYSI